MEVLQRIQKASKHVMFLFLFKQVEDTLMVNEATGKIHSHF